MPFERLDRPPLSPAALRAALIGPESWYRDVVVTGSTSSTNADLIAAAHAGAAEGTVHTTDLQTAGRGRLGRTWHAPAASSIAVSILLRPGAAVCWTILPLLTGLAVDATLRDIGLNPGLKWPNDVVVDDRKIAGIMIELLQTDGGSAAVVGIGLNTTLEIAELPAPTATSLRLAGADTDDRSVVLRRLLRNFEKLYLNWSDNDADIIASYRSRCSTIGRTVRIDLPGSEPLEGMAEEIDDAGRLVVDGHAIASGDVIHVRNAPT